MRINNTLKLIIAIGVSELAGIIGSVFTTPSIPTWYAGLVKPALNPPAWVFAPVWTTLFVLMGVAAFLIWRQGLERKEVKIALGIFIIQLILNTLWSIIFFGLKNPGAAFAELILLWLAILATIIAFAKISRPAAWLLLPYIAWVSFAGYLNFSIWQLSAKAPEPVYCTQEAKLCPDGSYVGRTGPNCEFAPCPSEFLCEGGACPEDPLTKDWKTATATSTSFTFKFPEKFSTTYIEAFDWPPQLNVVDEPFACTEGGAAIARAGETKQQTINDRTYCVTKLVEGAAGSTYTQYAYAFAREGKTLIFTFTTRAPQCANYSEPQQATCKQEQVSFYLNGLIDRIADTIQTL